MPCGKAAKNRECRHGNWAKGHVHATPEAINKNANKNKYESLPGTIISSA